MLTFGPLTPVSVRASSWLEGRAVVASVESIFVVSLIFQAWSFVGSNASEVRNCEPWFIQRWCTSGDPWFPDWAVPPAPPLSDRT